MIQFEPAGKHINQKEREYLLAQGLNWCPSCRSVKILEEHYVHLKEKVFFQDIVDYMTSGPVVIIAMEGLNGIEAARMLAGSTNSAQADPGSIRGTWALTIDENVIHVSDSVENGEHEYIRFF
mgnify:CR=1 FL=1